VSSGAPSFAIAFGGGGARGLAHIHVIEALDELGIKPVAIAGSSIGAVMGAGVAAGMSGKAIHEYCLSVLSRRAEVAGRMWSARPSTLAEAFSGMRFSQFSIDRILHAFLPDAIPKNFADLGIPLQVTATDYYGHHVAVLAEGDLRSAIAASAAIPAVFRPVIRNGRMLIDGGIYNPVPFDLLHGKADFVIAIDVVGAPVDDGRNKPNSIDLMFGSTQLMMQSITAAKLKNAHPDILLRPPVSSFRALDFLKIEAVMAQTVSIKEETKRAVDSLLQAKEKTV